MRIKEEAKSGNPFNVLWLGRKVATDSRTAYLFGDSYGALAKSEGDISASGTLDAFIAMGRFLCLPNWMVRLLQCVDEKFFRSQKVNTRNAKVDAFIVAVVDGSRTD